MAMTILCGQACAPLSEDQRIRIENDAANPMNWCCAGAAMWGPDRCTCWEPTYSKVQRELDTTLEAGTRATPCEDCAYRADSAEMNDERASNLYAITQSDDAPFWCHHGMRYEVRWRHPTTGMTVEAPRDGVGAIASWAPPIRERVPYRADGTPAERCAGWATRRRLQS